MIVITGAKGQLGQELCHYLDELGLTYTGLDSQEMDIQDARKVSHMIETLQPKIIFHCAAYTAVDLAEDEGQNLNMSVNYDGTRHLAQAAKKVDAILLYISTDYVFNGKSSQPYLVDSVCDPQNQYGLAKYRGEEAVASTLDRYYIIRTSWVFGQYGHNFVKTMKRLASQRDQLEIVDDQIGRPTWTRTLAEFMLHLVEKEADFGYYHLSNGGPAISWYQFAQAILENDSVKLLPISSSSFPQKAHRPLYSVLDLSKSEATGFFIPTWREALAAYFDATESDKVSY